MDNLHCVNCGAPILGKNINIQNMMAVCEQCNTVFKFDEIAGSIDNAVSEKVKTPSDVVLTESDDALEISYWYRDHLGTIASVVLWSSFLGLLIMGITIVMMFTRAELTQLLIMAAVALLCLGIIVTFFINRAVIRLENDLIRYYETPIRGLFNCAFKRKYVQNIYCESTNPRHRNPHEYYRVVVVMFDGSKGTLIPFIQSDIALYIQSTFSRRLNREKAPDMVEFTEGNLIKGDILLGDDGEIVFRSERE